MSYGMEYPFDQFGSAVLAMSPPKILATPSLLGGGGMLEKPPWSCVSTAQQQPKHWCVTNALPATDTKHITMRAAIGKINAISAKPSTGQQE